MKRTSILALTIAVLLGGFASTAKAYSRVGIGISVGIPVYRPWGYYGYPYYGWGYYRPVYIAPPPVIYGAAPVVVQPAPVIVGASPESAPVSSQATVPPISTVSSPADKGQSAFEYNMQMLRAKEESVRRDATMELGRMKADRAVDALTATLAGDASPVVRDAAARALGLIASPRSLSALIRAAQADNDRDVRHSAQFAVEIIRANLKN